MAKWLKYIYYAPFIIIGHNPLVNENVGTRVYFFTLYDFTTIQQYQIYGYNFTLMFFHKKNHKKKQTMNLGVPWSYKLNSFVLFCIFVCCSNNIPMFALVCVKHAVLSTRKPVIEQGEVSRLIYTSVGKDSV